MNNISWLKKYFEENLLSKSDLRKYLELSSVVSVELDQELVFDLMVLVPDAVYNDEFRTMFGDYFVIDNQQHAPPVFTRFKNHQWLRNDLSKRLPISLWIFGKSIIIQDPQGLFKIIVGEHSTTFHQNCVDIIRRKYIEFRSDRHNLRQAVYHDSQLAIQLLKANVIKLAMEIFILAHGKPYPYKKWLPAEATKFDKGTELICSCNVFMSEMNRKQLIDLSDELVVRMVDILGVTDMFSSNFLNQWWLHLD